MHAAAELQVKYTCLKAIKKGKFDTWPGLTYSNAAKNFPHAVETIKGYMVQSHKKHQSRGNKTSPDQVTIDKKMKRKIYHHPSKQKKSTSGINPSVNSTLMIVGDSRFDPEVVMGK